MKKIVLKTEELDSFSLGIEVVTVYSCLCGEGHIEYHRVPGFNDDWFEIKCDKCKSDIDCISWYTPDEWLVQYKK